ncbi:alanine racemase [Terasakiella sp. A23]|uniref:alanine racemase n=1 Tax=Terasakiella sp. FCG-A23 TaxID=3080561 RepID=UPI00295313C4|nr:alanine racemase [Terasakiella sp. A23]MDV7340643.1 alanine racemase [Terasakiella sp. A23]
MSPTIDTAGAILTIDLDVIKSNYKRLCEELGDVPCAAVVKADGYGLGVEPVAKALWEAGARTFFIAQIDEGITLRKVLPKADIHVLVGFLPGSDDAFKDHDLIPVLNSLDQIKRWNNRSLCDLHVDTGMTRLGISPDQVDQVPADLNVDVLMTHLACADDKDHPLTHEQIRTFRQAREKLPYKRASLANSSGLFIGPEAHFDLGRPGCALYGVNPTPHQDNPMANPVRLQGKIVQVHEIDTQTSVGYGATHTLKAGQKLATLALGYADGYLRSLSSNGMVYIGDQQVPVVGRVSMDLISIDITGLDCEEGQLVDVIGPHNPPDDLAKRAGTIGYEILTNLGARYKRIYK